jgi:hypothetical protein
MASNMTVAANYLQPDVLEQWNAKYGSTPAVAAVEPTLMTGSLRRGVKPFDPTAVQPVNQADYLGAITPPPPDAGGMMPTYDQVMTGITENAKAMQQNTAGAYDDVINSQKKIIDEETKAAVAKAKAEKAMSDSILQEQKNEDDKKKIETDAVTTAVNTAKELEDKWRSSTIEPKRWWSSKETGEKASAMVAVLLGNLGGALLGQGLVGNKMIDNLIDQDINLQQADITKKESTAKQAWRQVDDQRQVFADDRSQRATARLHRLTALEKQTEATLINANNEVVKKRGQALLAELGLKKQQAIQDIQVPAFQNAQKVYLTQAGLSKGGVPIGADPKGVTNYGYAADVTSAGKVKDAESARGTLKTAIQRARDTITEYGTWSPGGKGAAKIADAERTVFKAFQAAFNSGVLNKDEAERYKEMSGLSLFNSNTFAQEQLNLLEEEAENNFKNVVDANILPQNRVNQGPKRAPSER